MSNGCKLEQPVTSSDQRHGWSTSSPTSIGGLGVELADVAGNRAGSRAAAFPASPSGSAICRRPPRRWSPPTTASPAPRRRCRRPRPPPSDEIAQSRTAVETAVQHIAELVEAVGRIEHRLGLRRHGAGAGCQGLRIDRGDRAADQSAGAERDDRGGARRIAGRGFAVVASEVKNLAEATRQATQLIGDTVRGLDGQVRA